MDHPIISVTIHILLTFWCSTEFTSAQHKSLDFADCLGIYHRYSTTHSGCKPKNASCDIKMSQLTQSEIHQVLDLHNSYRSMIAQKETGISAAADMILLEWDDELALIAQRHSDQCIFAHDKPDERRVRNFGTGQNVAMQTLTGLNLQVPEPDWAFAVRYWFEEIIYFSSDMICNFPEPQLGQKEYRHFTQLIWSRSFRVGCGYTLFKQGNSFTRLYICNYGPAGNIYGSCVFDPNPTCSNCPINTQCTSDDSKYPGLCRRYNNQAPYQPIKQPHLFYCNFMHPDIPDCHASTIGTSNWQIIQALGGNYLETVLQPGQNATLIFDKHITGSDDSKYMCVQLKYRKGPNLAKDAQINSSIEIFIIPTKHGYTYVQNLPTYNDATLQQFSTYNLTLEWHLETQMKISFAVPVGASPQFFNIDSILAVDGECQN